MKHISESIIGRRGNGRIVEAPPRKENLDEGDIVLWRNGEYRIFLTVNNFHRDGVPRTGFYESTFLCDISNFNDELKNSFNRNYDVIRIFKTSQLPAISLDYPTYSQNELEKIVKNGRI